MLDRVRGPGRREAETAIATISVSTELPAGTTRKELKLTCRAHIFSAVAEPQDCASVHLGVCFPALVLFSAAAMTGAEH
jgi:hypothetical protein